MEIIVTISLSALFIVFFLLFCFTEKLRKIITAGVFAFVLADIITLFKSDMENRVALIIGGVVAFLALILMFIKKKIKTDDPKVKEKTGVCKFQFVANFLFGFCLTYLVFYNLVVMGDAALHIFKKDTTILYKLLTNGYPLEAFQFKLIAASAIGVLCVIFKKTFPTTVAGFVGGFMIVVFIMDAIGGNYENALVFSKGNLGFNPLDVLTDLFNHNKDIYKQTLVDPDFLHIYIAAGVGLVLSVVKTIYKRKEYDIF